MLIVISYPTAITDEATIINALFDEGLEIFHMRKPQADAGELRGLLEKINPIYHHGIALHQLHEVAADFGIKRWHFTEVNRNKINEEPLIQLKMANHILSTSIHYVEAFKSLPFSFDYTFFGPVLNSISKQGYMSSLSADFIFPVETNHPTGVALGGIDATTLHQVKLMQFKAIAVLGAIWHKPDESIQQFKAVQKAWMQTGR